MRTLLLLLCLVSSAIADADQLMWKWDDQAKGVTKIEIKRVNTKSGPLPVLHAYKGEELIGWAYCGVGKNGKTPNGNFRTYDKHENKNSSKFGETVNGTYIPARMPFAMRLTDDGIFIHQGPLGPVQLGNDVSAGCIRLPQIFAEKLFRATPTRTPVTINL